MGVWVAVQVHSRKGYCEVHTDTNHAFAMETDTKAIHWKSKTSVQLCVTQCFRSEHRHTHKSRVLFEFFCSSKGVSIWSWIFKVGQARKVRRIPDGSYHVLDAFTSSVQPR